MFCQFDNSYTSIQLEDNLTFVFEEVCIALIAFPFTSLTDNIVFLTVSRISVHEH